MTALSPNVGIIYPLQDTTTKKKRDLSYTAAKIRMLMGGTENECLPHEKKQL
jgi:hypothetical protein